MAAAKPDRRLQKRVAVDVAQLKVLLGAGLTAAAIGRALGVSGSIIRDRIAEHGLRDPQQPDAVKMRARPRSLYHPAPEDIDPALAATGGRYAQLAAYADRQGVSFQTALSRWHRLGRPVEVERERGPVADLP